MIIISAPFFVRVPTFRFGKGAALLALALGLTAATSWRPAAAIEPFEPPVSARILFPRIADLDLTEARALATARAPAIALSAAKVGAASADLDEQRKRIKVTTTGGLDPFDGSIRFYLALDLERLLQLNGAAREKARRLVEAERIGATQTQNAVTKSVTVAFFGLRGALATDVSARRRAETSAALYVAADARFKAGAGELGSVLGALSAQSESSDAVTSARHAVALASLDLAQACGYPTAEAMEAALAKPK